MSFLLLISFVFILLLSNLSPSLSQKTQFSSSDFPWLPTQNKILLSRNKVFAAGFKQIRSSRNQYTFSVWYYNIARNNTLVWSAKTSSGIDGSSSLVITNTRQLRLINSANQTLWSTGNSNSTGLELKNEGNLVFGNWQSFDFPTDTILPNQEMSNGTAAITSKNGKFRFQDYKSLVFDSSKYPGQQNFSQYWSIDNAFLNLEESGMVKQENGASLVSSDFGESGKFRRLTLDDDGNLRIYSFDSKINDWEVVWLAVQEMCTIHGTCGPNSICMNDASNSDPTYCVCPPGFKPKVNDKSSCEIKIQFNNNPGNTQFLQLDFVNFSAGSNQTYKTVQNFSMCQSSCLTDPKCLGFGFKYDGRGYCVLVNYLLYGYWSPGTELAFFLRVDKSETDKSNFTGMTSLLETTCPVNISLPFPPNESDTTTRNIVIICTLFAAELISGVLFFWGFLKKYIKYRDMARTNFDMQGSLMESEDWYFPRWAFDKVFKEMKVEDILDRQIKHCYDSRLHFDLINRMVKTAIWCLQDRPEARPSMGKVAKMLEGTVEITEPKKPTIFYLVDEFLLDVWITMALKSSGRKLSFDILSNTSYLEEEYDRSLVYRSNSDPIQSQNDVSQPPRDSRKKKKKHKKKKDATVEFPIIREDPVAEQSGGGGVAAESNSENFGIRENGNVNRISYIGGGSVVVLEESVSQNVCGFGELRQRNVNGVIGGGGEETATETVEESGVEVSSLKEPLQPSPPQPVANGNAVNRLETAESLDWKRLMAEDPNNLFTVDKSPVKYFLEEMYNGNSLRSTTTLGSEKERERVYDTIFRLPWRCEVLINVGFFVCFDSFLSLLTIMPTRILITLWRLLTTRQFKRPSAAELCDFGCFVVLACGVILLERTDISLIYHMIRGQGTIKLYVVYNVLEIFDKLCQSFGGDVLETLFNSAEGLANCSQENMRFWIRRFVSDQALAMTFSNILAITLSTCIVAHNNALFALLVSNNFAEIKSNVFKRFSKGNIHSLVYSDSVERFHISAFLLFVLAQNILEAEGPWFESFICNALVVFFCEMLIDIIKHSFLAKFNDIKPIAYSEFLEDLCKQTLNIQTENVKKNLTFVPLAPACVVSTCHPSADSGICCSPSMQSPAMEILLDHYPDFHDLCHAHKPKSDDRHGTTKTCNLVGGGIYIKRKTDWLSTILQTEFFGSCNDHQELRKNERNVFCIDCSLGCCRHCKGHGNHRSLQICKYVYQDVVRLQEIQKHLDCSKIQTYKINGEKAVHLNPRPQAKDAKPSTKIKTGAACETCRRYLQDPPNRFCSIACKVLAVDVKPKVRSVKIELEMQEIPDLSWKDNQNSEASTEEKQSSLSSTDVSEETKTWVSCLKPRKRVHKRKGIPHRAPLI
ncbi:S-locus glycoprotein [Corchorus olitorius]|uniref:S-locus glycoprotein n=1 Tax=Corchorus olitorius TaxID=93759 RepID=A0A1R3HPV5_9ROSI|nr:S-locus glycoprotein [Corchorus olitorius]